MTPMRHAVLQTYRGLQQVRAPPGSFRASSEPGSQAFDDRPVSITYRAWFSKGADLRPFLWPAHKRLYAKGSFSAVSG
jgi:hypothetical protein